MHLTFIADTYLDSELVLRFVFKSASCGWTSDLEGSYNADPVVRYSWFASGSSWVYLALPQFSKPDSFQNMTSPN
jgi:hypothetical protein